VRIGWRLEGRHEFRLRLRAAAREQRDVVARVDETVREQRNDELDAAVTRRRDGEPHRRNDAETPPRPGWWPPPAATGTRRCPTRGRPARARASGKGRRSRW